MDRTLYLMWLCYAAHLDFGCFPTKLNARPLLVKMMSITRRARNPSILDRSFGAAFSRGYATVTELPRPPPPTGEPHVETFSAPSKPRLYYTRPPLKADLPRVQVRALHLRARIPLIRQHRNVGRSFLHSPPSGFPHGLHFYSSRRTKRSYRALLYSESCRQLGRMKN
jgi:hypothetical protein